MTAGKLSLACISLNVSHLYVFIADYKLLLTYFTYHYVMLFCYCS